MFILQYFSWVILAACVAGNAVPLLKNFGTSEFVDILPDGTNYRLPTTVKPYHYSIKLWPNIAVGNFMFQGASSIELNVLTPVSEITLHAKNLTIDEKFTELKMTSPPYTSLLAINHTNDPKTDFLTITFKTLIYGNYTLHLKYNGTLHDDLSGFYRSSYKNQRGEEVWLATTQFEPTYARRAFPCFDEPALKATFKISINHNDNYTAVSNMRFKNIERDPENMGKQWTHFEKTPIMSTYLIAFVVSDFTYLATDDGKFRIWSKPSAVHNGRYALLTGEKELKALNEYTGIEQYGIIEKMDNFAIPQFRAGAMENWGIVTYRESALLYEENVTSTMDKQGIATVVSHEFAHQWFGNLVSPAWWDYTWLNEGFANYFQYYITDKVEDTWRLMDQFVVKNLQETAFIADDKENQHPMNGNVSSPLEISAFFDSITYSKAGSVIRMISHVLTEENFQTGIRAYLNKMKFEAANSDDLFEELRKAAPSTSIGHDALWDLHDAMDSWVSQRGYPVIHVTRNYTNGTASITQHRFLTEKTNEPKERWYIPINYATLSDMNFHHTQPSEWLTNEANNWLTISGLNSDDWIIVNRQQTGYYRVNYDEENWSRIIKYLTSEKYGNIHVLNRAQLLDDAFHLAQAGELSNHAVFLNMTTYLKQEYDYVPWTAAFRAITALNKVLANAPNYELFKRYVLGLIGNVEKSVGFNELSTDDHVTKFNRINVIKWACYVGSKGCAAAHEKFVNHIVGSSKISTDLQSVVLCGGMRMANVTMWEKAFKLHATSPMGSERNAILSALGCSPRAKDLRTLLTRSITPESKISPDDAIKTVLAGSSLGIDIAFDFINANLTEIVAINNGTESILAILNDIGSRMTTNFQLNKLDKFIEANKNLAGELTAKALVSARKNIKWNEKNQATISSFFKAQNLTAAAPKASSSNGLTPALQLILLALASFLLPRLR